MVRSVRRPSARATSREDRGAPRAATLGVALLFVAATAVQTLQVVGRLSEPVGTALGLAVGAAAIGLLLASGWSRSDCFLGRGRLSGRGALALGWLLLLWPFVLATGQWVGWDTGRAVTQALGGVAQELYFRAALLPLLLVLFAGRRWRALVVHAVLFTVWHAGAVLITPREAAAGVVALLVVALLAGISWGWQTLHDGTVWWAMAHHALLWVVGSLFLLAPPS
jgi:membrane protease YdiL (CAAX protease family)